MKNLIQNKKSERKIHELCKKGIYRNSKSLVCDLCKKETHLKYISGNMKHTAWEEKVLIYM